MDSDQQFLIVVLVLISSLALFIILPVLEWVLLSIILAYVLFPVHIRLREFVGSMVSALAVIFAALVAIIGPVAYILWVIVHDLQEIAAGETAIEVEEIEREIFLWTGIEVDLMSLLADAADSAGSILFGSVTGILSTALQFFIGIALVLFLVFYLLLEGEAFVSWVEELSPLPTQDTKQLFRKVNQTMWGSVMGHTFAAIVQAIVAGIGLWLAGVPNPLFWTVVMAILAFLPLIGAFLVWAPASGYLFIIGDTTASILLFLYGLLFVSMIDYYVRPLVIDHEAHLNPGLILAGVFGGIYTFGFVGLFVGPITIGVLAATLETIKSKQTGELDVEALPEGESTPSTGDTLAASTTEAEDSASQ